MFLPELVPANVQAAAKRTESSHVHNCCKSAGGALGLGVRAQAR